MARSRYLLLGGSGLAGQAIHKKLQASTNRPTEILSPRSDQVNLLDWNITRDFIEETKPEYVICAAAISGGLFFNRNNQTKLALTNMRMLFNTLEACDLARIPNLILIGSSCVYPLDAERPFSESCLHNGKSESTNEGYSISKISALRFVELKHADEKTNWTNLISTNLFGLNDRYHESGHLVGNAIAKLLNAKNHLEQEVSFHGTGTPIRQFMLSDDLASAVDFIINNPSPYPSLNVTNEDSLSVKEIIEVLSSALGYNGKVKFNMNSLENGNPDKSLDGSRMRSLGWRAEFDFRQGIQRMLSFGGF